MKNAEYWKQRFEQLEQAQNQMGAYTFSGIEKQYKEAQKQIEAQIAVWYQRFAKNNGITLAEARQFLKGSDLKEFKWDVRDYIKYGQENALTGGWMKELENASAKYHITKLEALKVHTQHSLETMFAKQQITMQEAMTDVFSSSYYHTAYELQHGFNVGWDIAGLDQPQIEKVLSKPWAADKYNFSERIWNNKQKLISEVHHELTQNIMLGTDPQKAIDSISKKMNTSKHNAGRLVMTEEAYFSSAAQKDCFGDLGVEQYEIVATLDSHTSDICRSLDGKVFPMADYQAGVTAPPFHVYCRSTTVPHFDENFGDIGERAARDEETGKTYYVPDDMNYQEWKETFVDGGDKSGFDVLDDGSAIHYKKQNTDSDSRQEEMNNPQAVSAASSFVPAKTVQEAQEYAQELGVKYADYSKFTPERANNVNMAISTLPDGAVPVLVTDLQKYTKVTGAPLGRAQKNGYAVTVAPYEIDPSAVGVDAPRIEASGETIVAFNTRNYKTLDSLTEAKRGFNERYSQRYGSRWHFNMDGAATDFHECGHVYQNKYGLPMGFSADVERWQRETGLGLLKSDSEAWAEAYGAYYTHREDLPDYIRRYFDPGEWKESSGSKVLSFDEWQKKLGNALDKSGESGIIEMTRRKSGAHRRTNARNLQIIDKPTYNKLTSDFLKHDGIIIRGEEAAKHLGDTHSASYLPSLNTAFIRDDATISEVLEEMYHAEQDRKNMFGDTLTTEVWLRREIDAQKHLLSLSEKYKIPQEEIEVTKGNLEQYEAELKKLLGGE